MIVDNMLWNDGRSTSESKQLVSSYEHPVNKQSQKDANRIFFDNGNKRDSRSLMAGILSHFIDLPFLAKHVRQL
jgi:hypothetical protein